MRKDSAAPKDAQGAKVAAGMTSSERRAARKAGTLVDWKRPQVNPDGTFTRYGEYRHAVRMDRWARRYDSLNGAPESEDDR